ALPLRLYHRTVPLKGSKKTVQQTVIDINFRNDPTTGKFEADDSKVKARLRNIVIGGDPSKPEDCDGKLAKILNNGAIPGLKKIDPNADEKYIVAMHGKINVDDGKGGTQEIDVVGFQIYRVKLDKGVIPRDKDGKIKTIALDNREKNSDGLTEQTVADMVARDYLTDALDGLYNVSSVSTVVSDDKIYSKPVANTGIRADVIDSDYASTFDMKKALAKGN
ncbi:MAG TPA: hypothetical protein VI522_08130, partial [Gammaproteobacteria bacterium]|nr:hypothetical protein [Gammaproteobacteria bacterium]